MTSISSSREWLIISAILWGLVTTGPLAASAQSVVMGAMEGQVRGEGDSTPIERAFVTVTSRMTGETHTVTTGREGTFELSLLPAGDYDVFVEAPGYRPKLLLEFPVRPGMPRAVQVELAPEPPPVERVDTVATPAIESARLGAAGTRWIPAREIERRPDLTRDLTGLATLSSVSDDALGVEGLPGSMTTQVVDGVPFVPARHPAVRGEALAGLPWPRAGMSYLEVLGSALDVEWTGAGGGYLAGQTTRGGPEGDFDLWGGGSLDELWTSDDIPDNQAFSAFWGAARTGVTINPDTAQLLLAVEGLSVEIPRAPLAASIASDLPLGTLEPGDRRALRRSSLEEVRSLSGLTRLDWLFPSGASLYVRVAGGHQVRDGVSALGPSLRYGGSPFYQGTDISAAAGVAASLSDRFSLEVRAGVDFSRRTFPAVDQPFSADLLPRTSLLESGTVFGNHPDLTGEVSRTGFHGGPVVHLSTGPHTLKGGVLASVASHEFDYLPGFAGEFFFSDAQALQSARGAHVRAAGPPPPTSFSIPRVGGFAQYGWNAAPGLLLTTGFRYDAEFLPVDDVRRNARWLDLTGVTNDGFKERLGKFSSRVGLSWDLTGGRSTVLEGVLGVHYDELSPPLLNEAIARDGRTDVLRVVGDLGRAWPDAPPESGADEAALLSLFGPELQAPRTARATLGLLQRIGSSAAFQVAGTYRRTEYLGRRTDLNRPVAALGSDPNGRPLWGSLEKDGSLVVATPGSNRRFPEFDAVWALTADGWSEYRGITLGFEQRRPGGLDLFGQYTLSETEDNWLGASRPEADAALDPRIRDEDPEGWIEGTSDFDVRHRLVLGTSVMLPLFEGAEVTAVYRYRSGLPFTPGYRGGVDINGDGSPRNDVAFVPALQDLEGLDREWDCLAEAAGGFPDRNACRGPGVHSLDLRLRLGLLRLGDRRGSLFVDILNLVESDVGVRDEALLLVDPEAPLVVDPSSGEVTVPVTVNPGFGTLLQPLSPGTYFRLGLSIGH